MTTEIDDDRVLALGRRLAQEVLEPMKCDFVSKDTIIDLLGVCLIAGENLFILGPPGTAKSALVHNLAKRLEGQVFDYLLTRFTEPSELFGPFLVPCADGRQFRLTRQVEILWRLRESIRMGPPHEPVTHHSNAQLVLGHVIRSTHGPRAP